MSTSWAKGSTTAWRKIRAAVLLRDRHRCRLTIEGVCTGVATCVHHVAGRDVTGDNPTYLVAACEPCNLKTGDPTKLDPPHRGMTDWGSNAR
jgi:5-methylcytosine-specific restriction endonuclease McrA